MKTSYTIKVYEHQALIVNSIPGFTEKELFILQNYYGQGCPYFSLIHNGVLFNQYVGVLQAGNITIEVLPKTDRGEDNKEIWQAFLIDILRSTKVVDARVTGESSLKLKSNSILEYYIGLFVQELRYLLQTGLIKKYRKTEGNSYALKGSLQFSKNIQYNLTHAERFYVRYSTYDRNNIFNRILYKTLNFISKINQSAQLQSEIQSLLLDFPELPDISATDKLFELLVYDRKTESYKQVISIAHLILMMYHPDIKTGKHQVLALMFDMNKLWEKYVFKQLQKRLLGKYIVREQVSTKFWKPEIGRMTNLKPDLVISDQYKNVITVFDTKWKNSGGFKPSMEDLRQMLAYNYYQECDHSALVYPSSTSDPFYIQGQYQKDNKSCSLLLLPLIKVKNTMQLDLTYIEKHINQCILKNTES